MSTKFLSESYLMIREKIWYLVQCKPRQDDRAEEHLARQGYPCVRPICKRERIIRGKRLMVAESLFPGYIFIQMLDDSQWAPLRSTRGVSRIVSFGGRPVTIDDELVRRLQHRAAHEVKASFQAGDNVRIKGGEFSEIDAIFCSMDGDERVVLLVNLLNRQQKVVLPLSRVSAVLI